MEFYMGNTFDAMFGLVFILIIGVFIFTLIKGISTWNKNNQSPRLTVDGVIVSKRAEVHRHQHANSTTRNRKRIWIVGRGGSWQIEFSGNKILGI